MKIKTRVVGYKDHKLQLVTIPEGQCVGCKGCSQATERELEVPGEPRAIGEVVWLSMEPKNVTKAAFLAYGLPLLLLVAGLFSSIALLANTRYDTSSELIGLGVGLALFITSYLYLRKGECERAMSPQYQAKIIENIEEDLWKH